MSSSGRTRVTLTMKPVPFTFDEIDTHHLCIQLSDLNGS
jgi:hypothetical protein